MSAADHHPSVLELERLSAGEPVSDLTRGHVKACAACTGRLGQMGAVAAQFSGSVHSSAARSGYARADKRWRRNAMLVALVPTLAAALAATASLVPLRPSPSPAPAEPERNLEVKVSPEKATPLRSLSLRGSPVEFGQGSLEGAPKEGPPRPFVLKHTEVVADVTGFVSSVTVTQEFENPFSAPVEAVYVFPLPEDAAVNELVLTAGGRVTRATIQKRAEARRRYEQAKSEGRNAALLDQERPNIFTQSVANLLPGETVKVTLTYVARVRYDDGAYLFNFPMVVGPRYIPGAAVPGQSQGTGTARDTTEVIDASRITPPTERAGRDIAVTVRIDAGGELGGLSSGSHRLIARRDSDRRVEVTLDPADRIPNRDLMLRWKVAGPKQRASMIATGGEGGTFALMVTPPSPEVTVDPVPKEMIFLIDTSCSMNGAPLGAAKRAMRSAMEQMNPADTFMLIDFADTASTFHGTPLLNTPQNVQRAIAYLEALPASGGTNQLAGLGRALTQPEDPERLRMVLLMTDGFIGNETQILAAVEQHLGKARIFGFGVGGAVNHFLLSRMSELGRGFYQYVRPDEDPEPAVARFVRRIERPLLTDVEIDWGDLKVRDVLPQKIPDLFDAQPLVIVGRNVNAGRSTVVVKGKLRGVAVEQRLDVTIDQQASGAKGLGAIWARAQIEELDRQQHGGEKAEIVDQITVLGLEHHLVTAYTSLVAIGEDRVAPADPKVTVPVGQPPVVMKPPPANGPQGSYNGSGPVLVGKGGGDIGGLLKGNLEDGDKDEFAREFGGGRSTGNAGELKRRGGYVPPAPGSASHAVKDSLGQSDVFQVISAHKPELAACVAEHRKREPTVSGKLVVRWRIGIDGKVFDVRIESVEFIQTYVAGCIADQVKRWTFPRHLVQGDPIVFPFKF